MYCPVWNPSLFLKSTVDLQLGFGLPQGSCLRGGATSAPGCNAIAMATNQRMILYGVSMYLRMDTCNASPDITGRRPPRHCRLAASFVLTWANTLTLA